MNSIDGISVCDSDHSVGAVDQLIDEERQYEWVCVGIIIISYADG